MTINRESKALTQALALSIVSWASACATNLDEGPAPRPLDGLGSDGATVEVTSVNEGQDDPVAIPDNGDPQNLPEPDVLLPCEGLRSQLVPAADIRRTPSLLFYEGAVHLAVRRAGEDDTLGNVGRVRIHRFDAVGEILEAFDPPVQEVDDTNTIPAIFPTDTFMPQLVATDTGLWMAYVGKFSDVYALRYRSLAPTADPADGSSALGRVELSVEQLSATRLNDGSVALTWLVPTSGSGHQLAYRRVDRDGLSLTTTQELDFTSTTERYALTTHGTSVLLTYDTDGTNFGFRNLRGQRLTVDGAAAGDGYELAEDQPLVNGFGLSWPLADRVELSFSRQPAIGPATVERRSFDPANGTLLGSGLLNSSGFVARISSAVRIGEATVIAYVQEKSGARELRSLTLSPAGEVLFDELLGELSGDASWLRVVHLGNGQVAAAALVSSQGADPQVELFWGSCGE